MYHCFVVVAFLPLETQQLSLQIGSCSVRKRIAICLLRFQTQRPLIQLNFVCCLIWFGGCRVVAGSTAAADPIEFCLLLKNGLVIVVLSLAAQ